MKTSGDGTKRSRQDYVLGLGTHVLKPQEIKVIPFEAEAAFRPEKFIFPPGIGDEFSLVEVSILSSPGAGDVCALKYEDGSFKSSVSESGRIIWIRWKGQSGDMDPSKGTHRGSVTIRNNSDHEALFKGGLFGPAADCEAAAGKNGDDDDLSLLEKAKRWYTSGFRQAVEDFRKRGPVFGPREEPHEEITAERWQEDATIVDMLRSLFARVIWYVRLPLDAAYFLTDQIEIREEYPKGESVPDERQDDYILGFGLTTISPESTQTIGSQAQVRFTPERLVIPSAIAPGFLIVDIKVGPNSQLLSTGAIPAEVFGEPGLDSKTPQLRMNVCKENEYITITVTNTRSTPLDFRAAILGPRD